MNHYHTLLQRFVMKKRGHMLLVTSLLFSTIVIAQDSSRVTPEDLQVSINVGGLGLDAVQENVQINSDGSMYYKRYQASRVDEDLETRSRMLTQAERSVVWEAIQNSDYFSLPAFHVEDCMNNSGGVRAIMAVTAEGRMPERPRAVYHYTF